MEFDIQKALPILKRTPSVLRCLLENIDEGWTHRNEGGDSWSPFDVMGHLLHGEKTDWMARLEIILNHGPEKTFVPFDRFAQFEESKGKTLAQLLDEFETARKTNIAALEQKNITAAHYALTGMHPAFGEVTLGQLLSMWTVHDLVHTNQITRVMATQYRTEIGPWIQYTRLLNNGN